MAVQTKGFCKYCGKEYARSGMLRHLGACKNPFWCDECLQEEYSDDEEDGYYEPEFLLPICNSPRMGVCGYEGSDIYPEQFMPDEEA